MYCCCYCRRLLPLYRCSSTIVITSTLPCTYICTQYRLLRLYNLSAWYDSITSNYLVLVSFRVATYGLHTGYPSQHYCTTSGKRLPCVIRSRRSQPQVTNSASSPKLSFFFVNRLTSSTFIQHRYVSHFSFPKKHRKSIKLRLIEKRSSLIS